ncbi:exodeoxyribonuclease V beta subunit [Friedmanniella luteola]|uniref:RecBCD enzyme subunit RecB n=1 Tax=Friedmanniella luteola TaxID=546871 RepID=A0A1H1VKK2_9ACTN|nr:UvrD-helicase domain-containing protein [Friedmanniella luteola]SDS85484.1 exodeoxyribonuclease V beta subunit [Friedmanniella luteola]
MSTATSTPPDRTEELEAFDVRGPLPGGTTVLEASAGTGKTFTIAALTARYLAEGVVELGDLMLVTFGRNASLELRLRVRERLVATEAALRAVRRGDPRPAVDEVGALLCDAPPAELDARHARVARALAEFDAATIATTHEFCLQMLDGLGVLGDREPQAVFVEHLGDLVREVTSDVYLRRYAAEGRSPFASFEDALDVAQRAVTAVHATLVPAAGDPDEATDAAERVGFVAEVRAEVERRKLAGRLFTYDDMLTRLRDALADPRWGEVAADRLRSRYRVVMVDEFQDTDPVQWEILRRAFHGHATLILIGDPKQAIYAFRGADVFSYLDAREEAGTVRTLATNWRSDAAVVGSLGTLMGGAALGDPRIVVRPVAAHHGGRRLRSADGSSPAPLRLRVRPHEADADEPPLVGDVRPQILTDLVADVTSTLAGGAELHLGGGWRPVRPADIAVLVRTNDRGEEIREALVAAGVPAVMLGAGSVFTSPMAAEWLTLLTALEQPRQQLARRAALTPFVGWTFTQLADATEDQLTDLAQRVRWWSRVLAGRGVAALMETLTADTGLPERLLGTVGGERRLTDLRHLAEALHAAMVAGPLGVGALRAWLQDRVTEARARLAGDGTRRLETDAEAVTVVTVHRSKGLEYPLVYLPDAWDRHVSGKDEGRTLMLHEAGRAVLDVGGRSGPGRHDRFRTALEEDAGENLRLLYVALTRAQCQVVAWWAPSHNTPGSALQRFLYRSRSSEGEVPAASYPLSGDPSALPGLGDDVVVEPLVPRAVTPWQAGATDVPAMAVRTFTRPLDLRWRRTSYSALTAAVHGVEQVSAAVGSEAEPLHEDDEAAPAVGTPEDGSPGAVADAALDRPSPMGDLPSGVDFGTAVHSVFELVDPTADDLAAELRRATAVALGRGGGGLGVDALATALLPSFLTPLGPLAGGRRLADIPPRDRLAELTFEMPLAGGDAAGGGGGGARGEVTVGRLAPLVRRHLGAADPLRRYAELLEHPTLAEQPLRGYLNGSIDAVLRVPDAAGVPRYLVVDYKTNWLGSFDGRPLTVGDYTPPRLAEAMMAAHYPLQALLYGVAVHRLLRWRQPGYEPATHLGGVLYLFVRGMAGADTPQVDGVPCGVFSWRPPAGLVTDLSDLLDGRDPEETR